MDGGDRDPTYDGFALDERGPRTITSPPEGRETRGSQNKKDSEGRGETPKGRPLPTLREIHQMNLRRALEEEMAEVPCDICGVRITTTIIARQGLCWNHKCQGPCNQARTTIEGISDRALVAGARRKDTSPWNVPPNSIANQ